MKKNNFINGLIGLVGALFMTIGLACNVDNVASRVKAEDNLPQEMYIYNQEPFSNVCNYEGKRFPTRSYLTIQLLLDDNVNNGYYYNSLHFVQDVYAGTGLTQQEVIIDYVFQQRVYINDNYYFYLQSWVDDEDDLGLFIGFSEYDQIRNYRNQQRWYFNTIRYANYSDCIDLVNTYYDIDIRQYVSRYTNFYTFLYQIEGQRLFSMVESYGNGYWNGYQNGVNWSSKNPHDIGLYDKTDLDNAFNEGIVEGYTRNGTAITIFNGILNVAMVPVNFFLSIFNFEILGINLAGVISALFSIMVVIIVIRVVFGKGGGSSD